MAKKTNRILIGLACSVCKQRNYISEKSTLTKKDKLIINKFCKECRKLTEHQEFKASK